MSTLENISRLFTGKDQVAQPTVEVPLRHPPDWWQRQAGDAFKETEEVTPEGKKQLVHDESSSRDHLKAYKDSKGIYTIGHGFNLQEPSNAAIFKEVTGFSVEEAIKGREITVEQQEALLGHTVNVAEADVRKLVPKFDELTPEQQDALTNFVFNVGLTTARQFKNTFAAINRGDGKAAAQGIRHSAYYRQVGARGERIAKVLETLGAAKTAQK